MGFPNITVGDLGNMALLGIPHDIQQLMTRDVDWDPLVRAANTVDSMAASVDELHARLSNGVQWVEGYWTGVGYQGFNNGVVAPMHAAMAALSKALRQLAGQIYAAAAKAAEMYCAKVEQILQLMQDQITIGAIGLVFGGAIGPAIADAIGGLVGGLVGDTIGAAVTSLIEAVMSLLGSWQFLLGSQLVEGTIWAGGAFHFLSPQQLNQSLFSTPSPNGAAA